MANNYIWVKWALVCIAFHFSILVNGELNIKLKLSNLSNFLALEEVGTKYAATLKAGKSFLETFNNTAQFPFVSFDDEPSPK
jgi:hypothetical protein